MTGEQRGRRAASKSGGGRGGARGHFQSEVEFINRELTVEEVEAYRSWRSDLDDVSAVWSELLEAGYRVNTKYDDYSTSHAAFIFAPEGDDNSGYCLTGRGGNPYRAVAEALFKHEHIFHGVWSVNTSHPNRLDDPDF